MKLLRNVLLAALFLSSSFAFAMESTDCSPLEKNLSFYHPETRSYFLALDTCRKALFESLGLKPRKKPARKTFANLVSQEGIALMAAPMFHDPVRKVIYGYHQIDNVYQSIHTGLGLVDDSPENEADYERYEGNLILEVQVCCDPDTETLVSCANIEWSTYIHGIASYRRCLRK
jgi:hypothetical protein